MVENIYQTLGFFGRSQIFFERSRIILIQDGIGAVQDMAHQRHGVGFFHSFFLHGFHDITIYLFNGVVDRRFRKLNRGRRETDVLRVGAGISRLEGAPFGRARLAQIVGRHKSGIVTDSLGLEYVDMRFLRSLFFLRTFGRKGCSRPESGREAK